MANGMHDFSYVVGIDLGTTNSAVACVALREDMPQAGRLRMVRIPQLTGQGEIGRLEVLPSFLYLPGTYDLPQDLTTLPWERNREVPYIVGQFARDHGARVPSRLISSAKSWLCHANVDRRAPILPWGAEGVRKMSPVAATAAYLRHIRESWNHQQGEDPENHLENQLVILTVPASFDEVARDLTVEAAAQAGLPSVTLLEEPLAAFYSWLRRHEKSWQEHIRPGELVLVCDVGGGTTDFTLITLEEHDGSLRFERMAVGDHLILGGDNADLALARVVEHSSPGGSGTLSGDRWKALCHQCRQAKEEILAGKCRQKRITLTGEGSRLIAGTLSATLERATVEEVVLDGFFPLVDEVEEQADTSRPAITEFGLPYEADPAVTRHLIRFMQRHNADIRRRTGRDNAAPEWLLFNGGSLKPRIIQERIQQAVARWYGTQASGIPRILDNPLPELAVAQGAAYYGLVKTGRGVRVGGGSPRSYYIGIGAAQTAATPPAQAVCVTERGAQEGSRVALEAHEFKVLTNQPVVFELFASSYRSGDRVGDMVHVDDSMTALPPVQTIVQYGKKGTRARIPVTLEAVYTEIGTLALWCRSRIGTHRWKLQFQLRSSAESAPVEEQEVFASDVVESARRRLAGVFDIQQPSRPPAESRERLKTLVKDIAGALQRDRERWPLGLIRTLADDLLDMADARRAGPDFESRWLNLCGFLLRPGFGDAADPGRMARLWKIYLQGPLHAGQGQVRTEWWILWRRVAGGLKYGQQRQFAQDVTPLLDARRSKRAKPLPAQERLELWMAAASMEQLPSRDRAGLGERLLLEIKPRKCKPQQLWSLSRIGAREPLYAPVDRVVPPAEVRQWLSRMMDANWRNPRPVLAAMCQMARRTGDRARDLPRDFLQNLVAWMRDRGADDSLIEPLENVIPVRKREQDLIFGERLPAGLILENAPQKG